MESFDLIRLEKELEIYRAAQPLDGQCDAIIDLMLQVVREDMRNRMGAVKELRVG